MNAALSAGMTKPTIKPKFTGMQLVTELNRLNRSVSHAKVTVSAVVSQRRPHAGNTQQQNYTRNQERATVLCARLDMTYADRLGRFLMVRCHAEGSCDGLRKGQSLICSVKRERGELMTMPRRSAPWVMSRYGACVRAATLNPDRFPSFRLSEWACAYAQTSVMA